MSRTAISWELTDASDSSLIAAAADHKPIVNAPVFDINAYAEIVGFIMKYVEENAMPLILVIQLTFKMVSFNYYSNNSISRF